MATAVEGTSVPRVSPPPVPARSSAARAPLSEKGTGKIPLSVEGVKQKLSATLLKNSWRYLLPSFGLTFLYILLHFVGAYIAGSTWFCKFGKEWPSIAAVPGTSKRIEYVEIIVVLVVVVGIALSILSQVVLYVAIIAFISGIVS